MNKSLPCGCPRAGEYSMCISQAHRKAMKKTLERLNKFFKSDHLPSIDCFDEHSTSMEDLAKWFSQEQLSLLQRIQEEVIMGHCAAHTRWIEPGFCYECDLIKEMRLALEKIKKEYE